MMNRPTNRHESLPTTTEFANSDNSHCVVLGGGGARGLAHLGAMHAIIQNQIPISRIVGVSMGALMGALCVVEGCTARANGRAMEFLGSRDGQKFRSTISSTGGVASEAASTRWGAKLFRKLEKKKALFRAVRSRPLLPSAVLRDVIDYLIPDLDIQDLATPLQIVTVDMRSGRRVVLNSGSLRQAIRASMSIPGVFPPVRLEGQMLSDIGVYDSVPCDVPAASCFAPNEIEGVIAVDVSQQVGELIRCDSALDAVVRFQTLAEEKIRQLSLASADAVIRPRLETTEWFDFRDPETIVQAGFSAAADLFSTRPGGSQGTPLTDVAGKPTDTTNHVFG